MEWFVAHAVLYFRLKSGAQRTFWAYENVHLVQAASFKEARLRAEAIASAGAGDDQGTLTLDGEPAERVFLGKILKQARERTGKSVAQVADDLNLSGPQYADMEDCDDELYTVVELRDVVRLTRYFGFTVLDLFARDRLTAQGRPLDGFESLAAEIREHLRRSGISLADFEQEAGWELAGFLTNPSSAWKDWNVDCLRDVSRELGVDWLYVLSFEEGRRVDSQLGSERSGPSRGGEK